MTISKGSFGCIIKICYRLEWLFIDLSCLRWRIMDNCFYNVWLTNGNASKWKTKETSIFDIIHCSRASWVSVGGQQYNKVIYSRCQ